MRLGVKFLAENLASKNFIDEPSTLATKAGFNAHLSTKAPFKHEGPIYWRADAQNLKHEGPIYWRADTRTRSTAIHPTPTAYTHL